MGFFNALAGKVLSGVRALGGKVGSGVNFIAGKAAQIGNVVGNVAGRLPPALAVINPALGETAAAIGTGAKVVSNIGTAVQGITKRFNI
jgi:hypothetical protein